MCLLLEEHSPTQHPTGRRTPSFPYPPHRPAHRPPRGEPSTAGSRSHGKTILALRYHGNINHEIRPLPRRSQGSPEPPDLIPDHPVGLRADNISTGTLLDPISVRTTTVSCRLAPNFTPFGRFITLPARTLLPGCGVPRLSSIRQVSV